jgi:riboflavin synthase
MFTGIVEALGKVEAIRTHDSNLEIWLSCPFTQELKVDQSLAHDGVCLTVTSVSDTLYSVTAVKETLDKTTLGFLKTGDLVNLERSVIWGGRLDGHLVQGHVDTRGSIHSIIESGGSWVFSVQHPSGSGKITVEKGSVCVNGVSLTVVNSHSEGFDLAIIPYTWEHTTFKFLEKGKSVNIEFDILGKYVERLMNNSAPSSH